MLTYTKIDVMNTANHSYPQQNPFSQGFIIICEQQERHIIHYERILRLEAAGSYTYLHLIDRKPILCSLHLGQLESKLQAAIFNKIHKSHIINLLQLKSYKEGRGGYVVMSDETRLEVAIRRKTSFLQSLIEFEIRSNTRGRQLY